MIETIKYRRELRKLNKRRDELERLYAKQKAKAKTAKEIEELGAEIGSEIDPILEEINSLQSKRFCQIAHKLLVPTPDRTNENFWCQRHYDYGYILTDKGIWEIKKLIRQEKRERREGFVIWLAALTGIIGATTGLAAVLSR